MNATWGSCSSPIVCLLDWKFIGNLKLLYGFKLNMVLVEGFNIIHCPVNLIFINDCQLYLPLYIKSKMNNDTNLKAKKYKKPIHK